MLETEHYFSGGVGGVGLRNFQMQTFFVTIPIQTIFFFRGILLQTIVLAHLLVGFATLLLRLTMPDFGRTVFRYVLYVFTWFFCFLLISAFNFRRVGMGGGGVAMGANALPPPSTCRKGPPGKIQR